MKKRSREENAAYSRTQRLEKKRITTVSPTVSPAVNTVSPVEKRITRERITVSPVSPIKYVSPRITQAVAPVSPVAPCKGCTGKELEIKRLVARIALLEVDLRASGVVGCKREGELRNDDYNGNWTPTGLVTKSYKLRPIN